MARIGRSLIQAASGRLARRSGASARVRRKASLFTSAGVCVTLLVACSAVIYIRRYDEVLMGEAELDMSVRGHRRLSDDDSSLYPTDLILGEKPYQDSPQRYWVFIHVILIGYCLLGLNTVCDVYFTGALDVMVDKWDIKPDVAGATFMAAGGSAPELFTSLVGACVAKNDVGFGTIVGSAVFNVLFVIGLCGFAAHEAIKLTWWPLFRDCTFYILGLSLLALCASDQQIEWWEALVLFAGYLLYILFMYNNEKFEHRFDTEYQAAKERRASCLDTDSATAVVPDTENGATEPRKKTSGHCKKTDQVAPAPPDADTEAPRDSTGGAGGGMTGSSSGGSMEADDCNTDYATSASMGQSQDRGSRRQSQQLSSKRLSQIHGKMHGVYFVGQMAAIRHEERMAQFEANGSLQEEPQEQNGGCPQAGGEPHKSQEGSEENGDTKDAAEDEEEDECLMAMPEGFRDRILWYLSLPVYVPLYYLTPEPDEKWFMATFGISLLWIAGFSFFMVWWFEIIGELLGIPTLIMGLTVIAAGTSIPDAASSVAVARMGEGDMAVSSSIGSNIFDILVGLPVPWMVKIGLIELGDFKVPLKSEYLTFYVLLLMGMVLLVVISIHILGWHLNKTLGCCMGLLYGIFLVLVLVVEGSKPEWVKFSR